jgi:D-alanyl-D-alanine dipeptidase
MAASRRCIPALILAAGIAGCSASATSDTQASRPANASSTARTATVSSPTSTTPRSTGRAPSTSATVARIPPLSAKARKAGLVDIRTVVPDALVNLRYATANNFTHVRLYPTTARCLVHKSMKAGLKTAADRLRHKGYRLVFWDCYRPHSVQVRMFKVVSNPNWVARPGPYARSHEAARSVDVTLAFASTGRRCVHRSVKGHCLLDMGTGFDNFTPLAYAYATRGISPKAEANRARLRTAMRAGGISVYSGEWWHFDGPGAAVNRPHLNAPLH